MATEKHNFDISKPKRKHEVATEMKIDRKTFSRLINTGIVFQRLVSETNYRLNQVYLYPKQLKLLDEILGGLSDDTIE